MNPIVEQLELLKEIIPEAATLGVIYNSGEENSQVQVEILEKKAPQFGLTVIKAPVTATGEVSTAAESLVGKVDANLCSHGQHGGQRVRFGGSGIGRAPHSGYPRRRELRQARGPGHNRYLSYFKLGYQTGKAWP